MEIIKNLNLGEKKLLEKRCFEWFETWKIAIVVVIKLEAPNKQTPT